MDRDSWFTSSSVSSPLSGWHTNDAVHIQAHPLQDPGSQSLNVDKFWPKTSYGRSSVSGLWVTGCFSCVAVMQSSLSRLACQSSHYRRLLSSAGKEPRASSKAALKQKLASKFSQSCVSKQHCYQLHDPVDQQRRSQRRAWPHLRVLWVKGMLGINEGSCAAVLLHLCHGVQGQCRLPTALRPIHLHSGQGTLEVWAPSHCTSCCTASEVLAAVQCRMAYTSGS